MGKLEHCNTTPVLFVLRLIRIIFRSCPGNAELKVQRPASTKAKAAPPTHIHAHRTRTRDGSFERHAAQQSRQRTTAKKPVSQVSLNKRLINHTTTSTKGHPPLGPGPGHVAVEPRHRLWLVLRVKPQFLDPASPSHVPARLVARKARHLAVAAEATYLLPKCLVGRDDLHWLGTCLRPAAVGSTPLTRFGSVDSTRLARLARLCTRGSSRVLHASILKHLSSAVIFHLFFISQRLVRSPFPRLDPRHSPSQPSSACTSPAQQGNR